MQSRILKVDDPVALNSAVELISKGQQVVIPTETIYGFTCNALEQDSVRQLYQIKGRSLDKVSSVFLGTPAEIEGYAFVQSQAIQRVIRRFLPGPLTLVLYSRLNNVPGVVGSDGKIGIRISSHPFVKALCLSVGKPLIATSANLSGESDCRTAEEVIAKFASVVSLIIIDESSGADSPSTVIDFSGDSPRLIREGTIAFSEVLNCAEERS